MSQPAKKVAMSAAAAPAMYSDSTDIGLAGCAVVASAKPPKHAHKAIKTAHAAPESSDKPFKSMSTVDTVRGALTADSRGVEDV
ncbi:hypothetical protein BC628DRAFT_1418244 [Trametes gibbosa]|nr:hypothetical protein BC628DRAFT_1418244 [Trametes gibbosa]